MEEIVVRTDLRAYKRKRCEIGSSLRDLDPEKAFPASEAAIEDISEGGVRFKYDAFIPLHKKVLLTLEIPHQRSLQAMIEPVWWRELRSLSCHEFGARFLTLSDDDRQILREFVRSLPNSASPWS